MPSAPHGGGPGKGPTRAPGLPAQPASIDHTMGGNLARAPRRTVTPDYSGRETPGRGSRHGVGHARRTRHRLALPPDVERRRTVERWCRVLIRSRIAEIEHQDRLTKAARNEPAVTRLTEWKPEHPIGRWGRILVHTADCRLASGRTRPTTLRTFSP